MKKVALMQPYFFPYIGYFQLINAVDEFILYDDVQWMKSGWINRNRILENGEPAYITLPVKNTSSKRLISETFFVDSIDDKEEEIVERLEIAYKDAPYKDDIIAIIKKIFSIQTETVVPLLMNSLKEICDYLGINTILRLSSEIEKTEGLRAQDRVIDIVKRSQGTDYVNALGGKELYDKATFLNNGINLWFIKNNAAQYRQGDAAYIPNLSILDVLMFNSKEEVKKMLNEVEFI